MQFLQPIMGWGLLAALSRLLVDTDENARGQKIAAALTVVSVLNLAIILIIIGVTQQPSKTQIINDQILQLLPYASVAGALAAYPSILLGKYVADGKALQYRSLSLVGFSLQATALGASVWAFQLDAKAAILAMISAASVYAALSVCQLVRTAKWNVHANDYKALLMFGGPVVLYTIAGQSSEFVTKYVLAASVKSAEFGAFSAGMIYSSVIAMLASAINLAWVPLFYRHAQEWMALGVYRQFVDVFTAGMATCGAFLIIFSDELFALYSDGRVSLDVSLVGFLVISAWLSSAVWMSLSNPLFHQKRSLMVLMIVLLSLVISIPLALFLIDQHGVLGASLALFFSALTLCMIASLALRKLGIPDLNYSNLLTILFLLLLISSPIVNSLYNESSGLQMLAEKSFIFVAFVAAALIPIFHSGQSVLRVIESGEAQ